MDHRLELLGDDGLSRVRPNTGRRHREHRREVDLDGARRDGVAKADVDLNIEACSAERPPDRHARTLVVGVFLDARRVDGLGVEDDAVVLDGRRANLREDLRESFEVGRAASEQVEVLRRAMHRRRPDAEEHGALEDELRGMLRRNEPGEQSLVRVPRERVVELLAALLRGFEQSRANGVSDVRRCAFHAIDSR